MTDKLYSNIYSPSGNEENLAEEIKKEILPFCDKVYIDNSGNLITQKNGAGPKIVIASIMDEPSFISVSAFENGFLHVFAMGNIDPLFCAGQKITFLNGVSGILCSEAEEGKCADISNLFADIGAKSKDEALQTVPPGTCAIFPYDYFNTGENITGRGITSRVLCNIMINTIKELKDIKNEIYFAFISKGRLSDSGIKPAIYGIDPKYFISLEGVPSNDTPKGKEPKAPLGSGVYVKAQESTVFYSLEVNNIIMNTAQFCGVKCQPYINKAGRPAPAVNESQSIREGVLCSSLALGARYLNSPFETISRKDITDMQKLLTEVLKTGIEI